MEASEIVALVLAGGGVAGLIGAGAKALAARARSKRANRRSYRDEIKALRLELATEREMHAECARQITALTMRVADLETALPWLTLANGTVPDPPWRRVLDRSRDCFLVASAAGEITWASAAWEVVLGMPREHLIGRTWQEMVHPDDLERSMEASRGQLAGNAIAGFRNRWVLPSGNAVELDWWATESLELGVTFALARHVYSEEE